ncbi:hypothetical protein FB107DRAFT_216434 [Schizophyllum commune]
MHLPDVEQILRDSTGNLTEESAPSILSSILHVLLRTRSRPLDPDYVSEDACATLLSRRPELYALLKKAVEDTDCDILWNCDALRLDDMELRTRRAGSPSESNFEKQLKEFLRTHRGYITTFANSTEHPASWNPARNEVSAGPSTHIDTFVSSLGIPDTGARSPTLELHDLGNLLDADATRARLDNIFIPGSHTLFINTSGSGKTRLVLEGLAQHWGFYIPCAFDNSCLGSMDVDLCLSNDVSRRRKFVPRAGPDSPSDHEWNRVVTRNTFACILLSRLILLKAFVQELDDPSSPKARHRWLLFQVLTTKMGRGDIFRQLSTMADEVSNRYASAMISDMVLDIRRRCGAATEIFCVLDEAQRADSAYRDAFGRDSTALRAIASSWENRDGITIILTGTSMEVEPFRRGEGPAYRVYSDTGTFDTPERQRAYVLRYLPPELAKSADGKWLLKHIWLWLRGRYRFTASFVSSLLIARFEQPRLLLNQYISWFMSIDPPYKPMSELRQQLSSAATEAVCRFQPFTGWSLDGAFITTLAALFRILLQGEDNIRLQKDCFALASNGVAPLIDRAGAEASIHEPCVVLPLVRFFFERRGILRGFFPNEEASYLWDPPPYGCHHLALVPVLAQALMESKYPLCELFTFKGVAPAWATQTARLVRISRVGSTEALCATAYRSSLSTMARDKAWATDSTAWLQHETKSPFCLSSGFSNAEVLFVVRLHDGRCIYVALSTLFKNDYVKRTAADVQAKLSKMTPKKIFQVKPSTVSHRLRFDDLPAPVREAGNPPLLRLVATYPHETNIGELAGTVKQPVAVVNMTRLRDYAESYTVDDIVRRLSTVMSAPRPVNAPKRKRADSPNLDDDAEARVYRTRAVTKKMGALEGRADGNARPRAGSSRIAKERKAAPKKSPAPPPRKAPAPSGRGLKRGQNRR